MAEAQRIEVQKIACVNHAGFVMWFQAVTVGGATEITNNYPRDQMQTIDLANSPFQEGLQFWPEVHAILGKTKSADEHVIFKKNGRVATYEVCGTTLDYKIKLIGVGSIPAQQSSTPPDFPIPIEQSEFENWSEQIHVDDVWTCTPNTVDQVVDVCNWAREKNAGGGNNYKIRPRGCMHNWSPLSITEDDPNRSQIILVDTSSLKEKELINNYNGTGKPAVRVQTGTTMEELLTFLEGQNGGTGSAPGYSFLHVPAPGDVTVGGVLAIDGHGAGISTSDNPEDKFDAGYGSLSNLILAFTAVVFDDEKGLYEAREFKRGEDDANAFLVHLGRAFLVDVTLQVIDNYYLACESITDISYTDMFKAPDKSNGPEEKSFEHFLNEYGRVEVIWFPFTDNPWLKYWSVEPSIPTGYNEVKGPYNYPFSDNLSDDLMENIKNVITEHPGVARILGPLMLLISDRGLDSDKYPSRKIWGASKNTLLYVKPSTLRVTANGYAIQMKKEDVQQAVCDFTNKYQCMLHSYQCNKLYPINSPLEIRVSDLDDPAKVPVASAKTPWLSCLRKNEDEDWDVVLWIDVLTIPVEGSNEFYQDLEVWIYDHFGLGKNIPGRVMPEWSKGWAYTKDGGAWTNDSVIEDIRQSFGENWNKAVETLKKYDRSNLFFNPFLEKLFGS